MWSHVARIPERVRGLGIARPQLEARETGDLIAFFFVLDYFDPRGDMEVGKRLFAEKKCVVCHQVGGTGGVVGPNLDFLGQSTSPISVAAAMWNHGPAMAEAMRTRGVERPTFKDSELLDLIAFIRSASPVWGEGPLYVLPGRADEGRRLFTDRSCILCHSVGGQGGRVAPDLAERGAHRTVTQFAAGMWNKALAMLEVMKVGRIDIPRLRAEEMADLVAYLHAVGYFATTGDPRRGRELVVAKGCLSCHSTDGKGRTRGGDFARVKGFGYPAVVISALWNHSFITDSRPGPEKVAWPLFRPDEMADLMAFFQGLQRTR
jgi:mono/diheme cytochrome c family protein